MHKKLLIYIIVGLSVFSEGNAQKPYLQVQTSGGYSKPLMEAKDPFHFTQDGWNANLGFGMFFGKFGIMARGGYQRFASSPSFRSFVINKYKDIPSEPSDQNWVNAYAMIGPVFKFSMGRVDIDLFGQIGMTNLTVPSLIYSKKFVGQTTEIASYYGKNDELIPLWTGGITFHTRIIKGFYIFLEPSFLTNMYLSKTYTTFRYVNANDINMNGSIDDSEFFEAEIIKNIRNMSFSSLNLNLGISYQLGRYKSTIEPIPMLTLEESWEEEVKTNPEDEKIVDVSITKGDKNVTLTNESNEPVMGESNGQNGTGAFSNETRYDEAEARFLYRAGEMYFQANDFENAVACFIKLKNDTHHVMAKYMFALSLTEMQNCEEAMAEFNDFEKNYKRDDLGVLTTVFLSHYEKCKKDIAQDQTEFEKIRTAITNDSLRNEGNMVRGQNEVKTKSVDQNAERQVKTNSSDKDNPQGMEYKIQFVALKISNKSFPRLENIGNITHEYFPKKSMFRYTLGPYTTEDEAVSDMLKVRAMGFEDAFLAVYKNGVRTNTLYHSRSN